MTTKKKRKRTHKQRHMHMHTLKHKQRHTHKQKGTCSYTKSILYHCRKNGIQKKQKYKFQKNKCSMLPVVNSQSRVFQNDSKYSKSELQGTSDSKQLTLTSQKRNLSHVQSTCSSKTPRTLTTIFEVGGRGEAYKL